MEKSIEESTIKNCMKWRSKYSRFQFLRLYLLSEASPDDISAIEKEMQVLLTMRHPNIVNFMGMKNYIN